MARAADLRAHHPVQAYAIPLTADLSGVTVLCDVFPGAERRPVDDNAENFAQYLGRAQTTARIQAAQASSRVDSTPSSHGLVWPVNGPITSGFGPRWGSFHYGLDIGAGYGTPIHAAAVT